MRRTVAGGLGKFGLAAVVEMDREQNGPNIISLSLVLSANRCVERQVINKISSDLGQRITAPFKKQKD